MSASFACACSILYSDYDHRFEQVTSTDAGDAAAPPFVTADGVVLKMTVSSGNLFFAVGNTIMRIDENGGDATTWWTGTGPNSPVIVDLASNGTDTMIWSFGSTKNARNGVFVSSTSNMSAAIEVAGDGGELGNAVAANSATTWSAQIDDPMLGYVRSSNGNVVALLPIFPDGGKLVGASPQAITIDDAGVSMLATSARYIRYDLDGKMRCTDIGFALSIFGIATAPGGVPTYILDGTSSASGTLERYDMRCPIADAGSDGISLGGQVTIMTIDDTAAYWSTSSGNIYRAAFTENAGTLLATTVTAPGALAVGTQYLYASVGQSIFRFSKSP